MDPAQVVQDLSVLPLSQLRQYSALASTADDVAELNRATTELDRRCVDIQADLLSAQQQLVASQQQVVSMTNTLASTTRSLARIRTDNKLKFKDPAKFNGDVATLRTWLFSLRQYFTAIGMTDQATMRAYAATLLDGNALIWWESTVAATPTAATSWDFEADFVPALEAAFRDLGYEQRVISQFEQWTSVRGESIGTYIARFRRLCIELKQVSHLPDQTTLVTKFAQHLPSDARFWFGISKPATIDNAYQLAEDWDQANALRKGILPTPPSVATSPHSGPTPMELGTLQQQIQNLASSNPTAHASATSALATLKAALSQSDQPVIPQPNTPAPRATIQGRKNTLACHRCGRTNHLVRQCRARYHINGTQLPSIPQQKPAGQPSVTERRTSGSFRWANATDSGQADPPPPPPTSTLN